MKLRDRILVCLFVVVLVLPRAMKWLHVADHRLHGVLPRLPHPTLDLAGFRDESYQAAYTAWLERRIGWKGTAVYVDNTLLYHLFGDTRRESRVVVGDHHVLFGDEDIGYYNRDTLLFDPARLAALVDKIAALQAKLRAEHRAFIPVIIPAKTSVYRDEVPARWARDFGEPRISDERIYREMKRALDARGVDYVDVRAMFAASTVPRELLWGPTARHWSEYGACLALQEVARRYARSTGRPLDHDCILVRRPGVEDDYDYDLARLLNAWWVKRPPTIPHVRHEPPPATSAKPTVMFIGTSFCWTMLYDSGQSGRFAVPQHLDYYDQALAEWPGGARSKLEPHSPAWRDVFLHQDLYVLDMFESFLVEQGSYVGSVVTALAAELLDRP